MRSQGRFQVDRFRTEHRTLSHTCSAKARSLLITRCSLYMVIEHHAGNNPLYDDSSFVCIWNKVCQKPHDPDLTPKSVVRCLCEPDGSSLDSVPCWPREDHFLMGLGGSHGNEAVCHVQCTWVLGKW